MVYHLFANLAESRVLGKIWYVAMHLAIYLDVLDDIPAICLQSAVEVVEVFDTADLPCCGIEQLIGSYRFCLYPDTRS